MRVKVPPARPARCWRANPRNYYRLQMQSPWENPASSPPSLSSPLLAAPALIIESSLDREWDASSNLREDNNARLTRNLSHSSDQIDSDQLSGLGYTFESRKMSRSREIFIVYGMTCLRWYFSIWSIYKFGCIDEWISGGNDSESPKLEDTSESSLSYQDFWLINREFC